MNWILILLLTATYVEDSIQHSLIPTGSSSPFSLNEHRSRSATSPVCKYHTIVE